jgi:hypothetical protein
MKRYYKTGEIAALWGENKTRQAVHYHRKRGAFPNCKKDEWGEYKYPRHDVKEFLLQHCISLEEVENDGI